MDAIKITNVNLINEFVILKTRQIVLEQAGGYGEATITNTNSRRLLPDAAPIVKVKAGAAAALAATGNSNASSKPLLAIVNQAIDTTVPRLERASHKEDINNDVDKILEGWKKKFIEFFDERNTSPPATDPIQPEINGDAVNNDVQPRLDHKDAAIVKVKADFIANNSSTKLLPDAFKPASAPPTINRLGTKITPNFAFTNASQGSPDGTFPITKHHINPVIVSINLDNAIQPPAGPPNQPTLMARLTQTTIDDSMDPLPWIPKMQLCQPAFWPLATLAPSLTP